MENKEYKAIKISFRKAGSITMYTGWTDYQMTTCGGQGFLVIKNGETWVAMYAIDEIFSVVLLEE